jgi:glycosyltransferase involved in cell wall biosynthesis
LSDCSQLFEESAESAAQAIQNAFYTFGIIYYNFMGHVIIAVENLRIGGYQRLALDQAYYLSDISYHCTLLLLNPEVPDIKTFIDTENQLIHSKNLVISRLAGKRIQDFFTIRKLLNSNDSKDLVISHSMRSTVLFALARIGIRKRVVINTTIHQLPSLSKSIQRFKRFIYAQFGENLFGYSDAVIKDWNARYSIFGKRISLLRNGIYEGRLDGSSDIIGEGEPRLIFLGRNTSWKGIETYFDLFKLNVFSNHQGLMMIASSSKDIRTAAEKVGGNRIEIIEGANLQNFIPRKGDLHVYPSQYGIGAKFTEPISLNCLEMALLGTPSLVTASNENTWPELYEMGFFIAVSWENRGKLSEMLTEKTLSRESMNQENIRQLVSISNNVTVHLSFLD